MLHDICAQAERLNIVIQDFQVPGMFSVSVHSPQRRLVVTKNKRPSTKTAIEQSLRKIGIVSIDSIAGNIKRYDNAYREFQRRDGVTFGKGDRVYFRNHKVVVQGFRTVRQEVVVLLKFRDFSIEVDARLLSVGEQRDAVQPASQPEPPFHQEPASCPTCANFHSQNEHLRQELLDCRKEVQQYKDEIDLKGQSFSLPKGLPDEVEESLPETQSENLVKEIASTVKEIRTSFDAGDKRNAVQQQRHLNELVDELQKKATETTIRATDDCAVIENLLRHGIEIRFPSKPRSSVIASLKENGFRWNKKSSVWYASKTERRMQFAKRLCHRESEEDKEVSEVHFPSFDIPSEDHNDENTTFTHPSEPTMMTTSEEVPTTVEKEDYSSPLPSTPPVVSQAEESPSDVRAMMEEFKSALLSAIQAKKE